MAIRYDNASVARTCNSGLTTHVNATITKYSYLDAAGIRSDVSRDVADKV